MKFRAFFFLITLAFMQVSPCYAQGLNLWLSKEDSLQQLSESIWKGKTDSLKLEANKRFMAYFEKVLSDSGAFSCSFDSLSGISRLKPSDGAFRISTWNIQLQDGSFRYFGFIELPSPGTGISKRITLQSPVRRVNPADDKTISAENWYGALYYSVIQTGDGPDKTYTLLGWDGRDNMTNVKLIDVLSVSPQGKISFGKNIFRTKNGLRSRVIIEFAENASALVRYDYQTILLQKGRRVKKQKEWLIVLDHLVPIDPGLAGIRKYYVPSGDVHDAYIYRNGFWVFVEEILAGNPEIKTK